MPSVRFQHDTAGIWEILENLLGHKDHLSHILNTQILLWAVYLENEPMRNHRHAKMAQMLYLWACVQTALGLLLFLSFCGNSWACFRNWESIILAWKKQQAWWKPDMWPQLYSLIEKKRDVSLLFSLPPYSHHVFSVWLLFDWLSHLTHRSFFL